MRILFLLILTLLSCSVNSQIFYSNDLNYFKVINAEKVDLKIDSLIVIGIGSSEARIFQEKVFKKLQKELENKKIYSSFIYGGKRLKDASKTISTLKDSSFQIMVIRGLTEADSADDTNIKLVKNGITDYIAFGYETKLYAQNFFIELYDKKLIWSAKLEAAMFSKGEAVPKTIAKRLVKTFERAGYL